MKLIIKLAMVTTLILLSPLKSRKDAEVSMIGQEWTVVLPESSMIQEVPDKLFIDPPILIEVPTTVILDPPQPTKIYAGSYELTAYVATGNPCADGVYPQVGYTVACNDPALWHKYIHIEGHGDFYVHDTGGMASNVIDVFVNSYDEAIQFGRQVADVYIIEED